MRHSAPHTGLPEWHLLGKHQSQGQSFGPLLRNLESNLSTSIELELTWAQMKVAQTAVHLVAYLVGTKVDRTVDKMVDKMVGL